jgi:pyrroline-5-carboxylate reductase
MSKKTIGIIGFGNMGSAIAQRLKSKNTVYVFDKEKNKTGNLSGLIVAKSPRDLVNNADTVILAVKPQDFETVLNEIKDCVKDKLIISIAAGITTGYIEKYLGSVRVIRTMPNLPAKLGEGMTCLYTGKYARKEDASFAEELFRYMGKTLILDSEDMINAATAVSGSGPGFLCELVEGKSLGEIEIFVANTFIPALEASARNQGFTARQAKILAMTTGHGTVIYLEEEHLSPEEVKKQVTSKKGTTEAGLMKLKHNIANLTAAVKAALQRARELSK